MFDRLVGNQSAKETLRRMLAHERVPGALLFAGEEAVGKKLFAIELARALNCRARSGAEACGHCSSCIRTGKIELPPPDDADANRKIIWSEHRDFGLVRPHNRVIRIDVARELEREANFRPFEGRARIFLLEEADRLNESASNALLKTLEEAPPTTYFVLVTSRPASLLPTIRSRSQTVRFAPLTVGEVERFLVEHGHRAGEEARMAARLSGGRVGRSLAINLDSFRERREAMLEVVEALVDPPDKVRLLRAAEELSDAKRKEEYEPRLETLETLIHDIWLLDVNPEGSRLVNEDLREKLLRISSGVTPSRAARWLLRIEELRGQLAVNVNRRVATDALFLAMAADG